MKNIKKFDLSEDDEKKLIKFLSKVSLFKKLSKHERKQLSSYCYVREYSKDEQVFKKGYPSEVFYLIQQGEVLIYLDDIENPIELNNLSENDYFGEIGLFVDEKRTAHAICKTDCVFIAISKRDFSKFINKYPRPGIKVLYDLGAVLSREVVQINNKLIDLTNK